jgi:hypothetical protein
LTRELSGALAGLRERRGKHDLGRVIRDLAVMLADGGDCLSDLRAVRDQEPLFGPVASDTTAFRLIDRIASDPGALEAIRAARARARARVWELGARPEQIVIDVDATLIRAHTEKEGAAVDFKGGFGFHPLLAYLDASREALAGTLRPGNAPAHGAADQIAVLEQALEQLPREVVADLKTEIVLRADSAGAALALCHAARTRRSTTSSGSIGPSRCAARSSRCPSPRGARRCVRTAKRATVRRSPRSRPCSSSMTGRNAPA